MLLRRLAVEGAQFEGDQPEALAFEAVENLTYQATPDGVGLHENERALEGVCHGA